MLQLDEQLLDGVLQLLDLSFQLASLVGGDRSRNDRPRHAAGTAKGLLGWDEHVWHVLKASSGQHKHVSASLGSTQTDEISKPCQGGCGGETLSSASSGR